MNKIYYKLPYTICIIKRADKILLINKDAKVWMGRWNGVGGKIKKEETPEECIIREVHEETGIQVAQVNFKGIVTWPEEENTRGGMYLFFVELPPEYILETPIKNREGILDWKEVSWILHSDNRGVVDTLPKYLPTVLRRVELFEYYSVFQEGRLRECTSIPITSNQFPIN
ncbi:8-oxo-dGTP diphosphatase [Shimazuella sp. AN120528]|uniref:NUDIX hydrolase n=1 Tax=Shimazuella soli TaxID=1892854 RepID=UPI001F0E3B08|nr:8-oxo-dGTP diphosphatase [Shimazuella soli]MCH5586641.1 8-oxo-dGTP diphosphatase [Shimazuella soli]